MSVDIRFFNAGKPKPREEAQRLFMEAVSDSGATLEPACESIIRMTDGGYVLWREIDEELETSIELGRLSIDVCRFLYTLALKTEWVLWSDLVPHSIFRPIEQIDLPVTRTEMEPPPEALESPEVLHALYSRELARRAKIADKMREHIIKARQQRDQS